MIVVADASPLNYLIQLESVAILEQLYGQVLVPEAVMQELRDQHAPKVVRHWSSNMPSWAEVGHLGTAPQNDSLGSFGAGEREAILLAQVRHADLLLIDERRGELEAKRRGISAPLTELSGRSRHYIP